MVKIAFWDNQLYERGTTVSLFDYAYYNIHILGNESYIFYDENNENNNEIIIQKFKKHFNVIGLEDFHKIHPYLEHMNIMFLYIIKYGTNDGFVSKHAYNLIHSIFECEPHGDVYASISLSLVNYNQSIPIVPHIINLPEHSRNMRSELNISEYAMVYGRYGGKGGFDIEFVHKTIYNFALKNPTTYFLFANTNKFCEELPNIIHIPAIIDLDKKVEFINTCDAMIYAGNRGENFGLSIAEFSTKNKPILCCSIFGNDDFHLRVLGYKAILYNENSLDFILSFITNDFIKGKDWNAYHDYTPEKVMKVFYDVYLKKYLEK